MVWPKLKIISIFYKAVEFIKYYYFREFFEIFYTELIINQKNDQEIKRWI